NPAGKLSLERPGRITDITESKGITHQYTTGAACTLFIAGNKYCIYHPAAPLKRRGRSELERKEDRLLYRYWRCTADEKVPMQPSSWQRAEVVIAPAQLARFHPSLQSPHEPRLNAEIWNQLYDLGK